MGFVLSLLYLIVAYMGTDTLFGSIAEVRLQLVLAILVFLVSIPSLTRSFVMKTTQSLALMGLAIAVFMSVLVAMHWASGAASAFMSFIPSAYAYFVICLHCNSKKRLRILIIGLLLVCLYVIARGSMELKNLPEPIASQQAENPEQRSQMETPYLMSMHNDSGEWFYRLRGQGFINDPNDLAQLIVCVIPLVFIFWVPKGLIRNTVRVILPVCALVGGLYLTHSRGGLLALSAVVVVAARRRVGTIPSLLLGGALLGGAIALHITGGRDISLESGSDRTELWSQGLQLLKSHPLFGVGLGQMPEYIGHTAHNSIVVCAAELGLFGLFFWTMFLFPTMRAALIAGSVSKAGEEDPDQGEEVYPAREAIDPTEVHRLGRLILLSLVGFLVAGWFLSRAFVMTFFLLGGMAEVVYEMGLKRRMLVPRLRLDRVGLYTGGFTISLVLLIYVTLRITNLTR